MACRGWLDHAAPKSCRAKEGEAGIQLKTGRTASVPRNGCMGGVCMPPLHRARIRTRLTAASDARSYTLFDTVFSVRLRDHSQIGKCIPVLAGPTTGWRSGRRLDLRRRRRGVVFHTCGRPSQAADDCADDTRRLAHASALRSPRRAARCEIMRPHAVGAFLSVVSSPTSRVLAAGSETQRRQVLPTSSLVWRTCRAARDSSQ